MNFYSFFFFLWEAGTKPAERALDKIMNYLKMYKWSTRTAFSFVRLKEIGNFIIRNVRLIFRAPKFSIWSGLTANRCTPLEICCFRNMLFLQKKKKKLKKKTVAWLVTEYDVAWGILKFQCKTWEFRATSYSVNSRDHTLLNNMIQTQTLLIWYFITNML